MHGLKYLLTIKVNINVSQLLGLSGIIYALWYVMSHPAKGFTGYFDDHAFVMLSIMPPSVMLLSHTLIDLFLGVKLLISASFKHQKSIQKEIVHVLTVASKAVRQEGLGVLSNVRGHVRYDFLNEGLSLVLNDFKPDEVRHNLEAKIEAKQMHMQTAANLFENMSKLCPGVGMIGTLFGLIHMLSHLDDPTKLGGGMAMAMITTLYGLILGTCIYGPWGEKILIEADKILENDRLVLEGVLQIQEKKSTLHLQNLVKTYGKISNSPELKVSGQK